MASYKDKNSIGKRWNSYLFLKPAPFGKYKMRPYTLLRLGHDVASLDNSLLKLGDEIVHFDFETMGLSPLDETKHVVSVSCATTNSVFVADCREWGDEHWGIFITAIVDKGGMCFNVGFDYKWLYAKAMRTGRNGNAVLNSIQGCTLTLFRMLSNERWLGQRHNLEAGQELLRIPTNKTWLKEALERNELKKGDMYKLLDTDYEDFLKYNAEDSDTSVWLWQEFCEQLVARDMEHIISYHQSEVVNQLKEFIEQWWVGMPINREALQQHYTNLALTVSTSEGEFRNHPDTKEYIEAWEKKENASHFAPTVNVKKVWAKKVDDVPNNPDGWIFDAGRKTLAKWEEEIGGRFYKPEYKVVSTQKPPKMFSLTGDSIRPLFFGHLHQYETYEDGRRRMVKLDLPDRQVELRLTKKGQDDTLSFEDDVKNNPTYLPFDGTTYAIFGELGNLLKTYNKAQKEMGYVKKCLERSEADGRVHLEFISGGTMTGRANGAGGFNFLQQPKSEAYMKCMIPPEGFKFVDVDVDSLEKVIQAEFSGDANLKELYGSDKTHDVYLYNAMNIHPDPAFREELKSLYKPDAETIDMLKKKFKKERTFIKPAVLGLDYGLYPYSLYLDWQAKGYDITYDQCFDVFKNYWKTYGGVKEWEKELLAERQSRGGWIVNAYGHPICVTDHKANAVVNSFCQNSGHTVLMTLNRHIREQIDAMGIKTHMPVIQDFHDERISMCREDEVDKLVEAKVRAMDRLNDELQPGIPFSGTPEVGDSIWQFKA